MNKIGFRTAGFRDWALRPALRALADCGYDGVELCLEHPEMRPESLTPADCARLRELLGEVGLELASVSYHGDREEHQARAANQLRAIAIAHALGADVLILNSEHVVAGHADQQWEEFVGSLRRDLLPAAADAGVRLALEPEPGMFVHGTREMLALLAAVDHPALAVNLDIGHAWLTDDDLPAAIRELTPYLAHLHWEDFPQGEHRHLPPGQGDMPLAQLHDVLRAVGYAGYYTIDLFNITADPVGYAAASLGPTRELLGR